MININIDIEKFCKYFFDSATDLIRKIIKDELKYNYTLTGVIIADNGNGTYEVRVNNDVITVKSLHGQIYVVNDVVYVIVLNKDISKRFILDKVY